jgi:hypothetical protein
VADGLVLDTEITLRLDITAGISECSGIGLGVCFDGPVANLVELLDIKDARPALASGSSEVQCILSGVISDC